MKIEIVTMLIKVKSKSNKRESTLSIQVPITRIGTIIKEIEKYNEILGIDTKSIKKIT